MIAPVIRVCHSYLFIGVPVSTVVDAYRCKEIVPRKAGQCLRIEPVILAGAVRDQPYPARIRHDDFMVQIRSKLGSFQSSPERPSLPKSHSAGNRLAASKYSVSSARVST